MSIKYRLMLLCFAIGVVPTATPQQLKSTCLFNDIKNYDAGKLWHTTTSDKADAGAGILPEPLGIISETYQRFYIHYNTITKCKTNPCQYIVTGKTKVKENLCSFKGTITIVRAGIYVKQFDYRYKQGVVECEINFKEDSSEVNSGFFKGKLTTTFYLDERRNIQYDDLLFGADGYFNNQCEASWTSYFTHKTKKVKWGDYRIPGNTGFDIGDGEFMIADKYLNNGWHNYKKAHGGDPGNVAAKNAGKIEAARWWK